MQCCYNFTSRVAIADRVRMLWNCTCCVEGRRQDMVQGEKELGRAQPDKIVPVVVFSIVIPTEIPTYTVHLKHSYPLYVRGELQQSWGRTCSESLCPSDWRVQTHVGHCAALQDNAVILQGTHTDTHVTIISRPVTFITVSSHRHKLESTKSLIFSPYYRIIVLGQFYLGCVKNNCTNILISSKFYWKALSVKL